MIALAAIFGFRLFLTDISQSYLQSAEALIRDVYVKAPKELELGPDMLLKLLKPLYGLSKSGDYWGRTQRFHLIGELGMITSTTDSALFFKHFSDHL